MFNVQNEQPWLTKRAIEFLDKYLVQFNNPHILEFGSGGSTIWFSKRTNNLVSVEHRPRYYNPVSSKLTTKVDYRLKKLPYDSICNEFDDDSFDLALIDGRQRVKCAKACKRLIKKNGILMLDNAERDKYKAIFDLLKDWKLTTTEEKYPNNKQWLTCWWKRS